jgi:predicted dehydrogenase
LDIKYNEFGDKSGNIRHEEIIKYETNNSWNSEIREFFDAISENKHISNGNSEQAYQLMEAIDRIYQKR